LTIFASGCGGLDDAFPQRLQTRLLFFLADWKIFAELCELLL
jgi:hypothetical protein